MFSLLASRVGPRPASRADSGRSLSENRADEIENHANLFSTACSQDTVKKTW